MSNKKKSKRQKKVEKNLDHVITNNEVYNILFLLKTERMDSKPNLAKFIETYVKHIRGFNSNKISFYPDFKYEISKIFVKFLDGHELIYDIPTEEYFMYYNCDEVNITDRDKEYVKTFFEFLLDFKFVY